MFTLGEIVQLDTKGQFRSDVQISNFDDRDSNLALLQAYIFSVTTPGSRGAQTQAIAALGLLDELLKALKFDRFENRMLAIANYGYGKSHLAVVLANYFSRPYDSPEVKIVLDRIGQAVSDPAKAEGYREFKKEHGEYLVVRLRGDSPRSLREQFFLALKKALSEHAPTRDVELPFWVDTALNYLRNLTPEMVIKADAFLQSHAMDVPALLDEVEQYRAYELYVELFEHLSHGVRPSAEGNASLREAVRWVVGEFCGEKKPLAGLLILFDEFSMYVQRYARSRAVGELQDLLQGVEDHRTKAAFLAFAQHDPELVADQTLHGGQSLQNLRKELQRIPRRWALYSLMEGVLDSYLKQDQEAWEEFLRDFSIKGAIFQATEHTWGAFQKYYDAELDWSYQKFRQVVTEGCFPLHPMTTALLCQIKVQQGEDIGTARTALGFVRDQLDARANEPAQRDGRVNWVLPVALVDYFERRLAGDAGNLYTAYDKAQRDLEQIFGENVTEIQRAVLKALLLQEIARLSAAGEKQTELLASMCGSDEKTIREVLKDLSRNGVTRYDSIQRINGFLPVGADPRRLEKAVQEQLEATEFDPGAYINGLNRWLREDPKFGSIPLEIEWGHASDWAAEEHIIIPDAPISVLPLFSLSPDSGLSDGIRGAVLWLVTLDDAAREDLREQAQDILEAAVGLQDPPLPVIVMIPRDTVPEMKELYRRYQALEAVGRDKDLIKEVGQQTYELEVQRTRIALHKALKRLRGDYENVWEIRRDSSEFVVPKAYRTVVATLSERPIKHVLKALYEYAYPIRPPEFFTQYSAVQVRGQNRLRTAVKTVAKNLIYDRVEGAFNGMDSVSRDLCEKYLSPPRKWGLLSVRDYALQQPTSMKLSEAWKLLNRTFEPGVKDGRVAVIVPTLLNPPYGFDYNTATLLLCGWIGYFRNELRLSAWGQYITLNQLERQIETTKTSRGFLDWACRTPLTITRRDPDAAQREAQEIIRKINKDELFTQEEAQAALQNLEEFAALDNQSPDIVQRASRAVDRLEKALREAQEYDREAGNVLRQLDSERDIANLLKLRDKLRNLPVGNQVHVTQSAPNEIEIHLNTALEQALRRLFLRVDGLTDSDQAGSFRRDLAGLKKQLEQQGLTSLAAEVAEIQGKLNKRADILKAKESEAFIRNEIDVMNTRAGLAELRRYETRLQEIEVISPDIKSLQETKLREVQDEIRVLEAYAESINDRAYNLDLAAISEERDTILRQQSRYQDTEFQNQLEEALEYLDALRKFVRELEGAKHIPDTPADVEAAEKVLAQMSSHYGQMLSRHHLKELDRVREQKANQLKSRQQDAIQWLEERESEFGRKASPGELKRKLERPPAFLPLDYRDRLKALHTRVQECLDQDQIARIEELFRALGSTDRRQDCLDLLQRLMSEEMRDKEAAS